MCRRGLTLLLLPAILLTQWVSVFRCAGGCGAASQNGRPHVHLNAVIPGTPEPKGCGCQRQRDATPDQAVQSAIPRPALVGGAAATEQTPCHGPHDDVVYLSFDAAHGVRVSVGDDGVVVGGAPAQSVGLDALPRWPAHHLDLLVGRVNAPPRPSPRCPVYVLTRSLLI